MTENYQDEKVSSELTADTFQNIERKNQPKNSKVKYILTLIFTLLVGIGIGITGVQLYAKYNLNAVTQVTELPERLLIDLSKSYQMLKRTYIGDIDDNKLIDGALSGFVSGVGDTYTTYLNEAEMDRLNETTDSEFDGVGIEVEQFGEFIRVVSPIDGSPASQAGIKAKDLIVKVDGEDITGKTVTELVKVIRGKRGTKVTLTIRRDQVDFDVELTRDKIPLTTVKGEIDIQNKAIGIIRISSFSKTTYDELVDQIKKLRELGAKSFVIDVRENPGGLLDSVTKIVNMFVDDNVVMFQMEDTQTGKKEYKSSSALGTFKVNEPVTVLINHGSASASEIFASALKELNRAQIVGTTSFGKGTAQTIYQLSDKTGLKVTYSKWLTPLGNWINQKGVEPNVLVELPSYSSLFTINTAKTYEQNTDYSDEVFNIQKILTALQYDVSLSGVYDSKFVTVVQQFQKDNQLPVTGKITADTATKINELFSNKVKANDTQLQKAKELLQ